MTDLLSRHAAADAALSRRDLATAANVLRTVLITNPDDFDGWMKLAAVARLSQDFAEAMTAVDEALRVRPLFYLPLLLKGSLLRRAGNIDSAMEVYRAALFHAETNDSVPPIVRQQLAEAAAFVETQSEHLDQQVRAALASGLGKMTDHEHWCATRFADNVIHRRRAFHQEPTHFRFPGFPDIEYFDNHFAKLRARVEAATTDILREFNSVVTRNFAALTPYVDFRPGVPLGQWAKLNRSSDWNALHLIRYGERIAANADLCPITMACLTGSDHPDVSGITPNLMFSVLAPRTRIPPHHGVANFRTVLHLPLIVPDGCGFRVGADTRTWEVGKAWVFDDTIEHEAWNDSDQPRVILIADLWRPELDDRGRDIVRSVMSALSSKATLGAL